MAVSDDMHEYVKTVFIVVIGLGVIFSVIGFITVHNVLWGLALGLGVAGLSAICGAVGYFNKKRKGG